uniref:Uncharacterized protein n=1 Tax=Arundo donax TaxID=35708 RepID=A0A0A9BEE9_ARUDO
MIILSTSSLVSWWGRAKTGFKIRHHVGTMKTLWSSWSVCQGTNFLSPVGSDLGSHFASHGSINSSSSMVVLVVQCWKLRICGFALGQGHNRCKKPFLVVPCNDNATRA